MIQVSVHAWNMSAEATKAITDLAATGAFAGVLDAMDAEIDPGVGTERVGEPGDASAGAELWQRVAEILEAWKEAE